MVGLLAKNIHPVHTLFDRQTIFAAPARQILLALNATGTAGPQSSVFGQQTITLRQFLNAPERPPLVSKMNLTGMPASWRRTGVRLNGLLEQQVATIVIALQLTLERGSNKM
jgi:hypothetical protein